MLPTLTDGRVALRPLDERDADALAAMTEHPSVREWWGSEESDSRSAEKFAEMAITPNRRLVHIIPMHFSSLDMWKLPELQHLASDDNQAPSEDFMLDPDAPR